MLNFLDVIEKIKIKLGLTTDKEVAKILQISQASFSQSKVRNSIPYKEILELCKEKSINSDWLFLDKELENQQNVNYKQKIIENLEELEEKSLKKIYHISELEKFEK